MAMWRKKQHTHTHSHSVHSNFTVLCDDIRMNIFVHRKYFLFLVQHRLCSLFVYCLWFSVPSWFLFSFLVMQTPYTFFLFSPSSAKVAHHIKAKYIYTFCRKFLAEPFFFWTCYSCASFLVLPFRVLATFLYAIRLTKFVFSYPKVSREKKKFANRIHSKHWKNWFK